MSITLSDKTVTQKKEVHLVGVQIRKPVNGKATVSASFTEVEFVDGVVDGEKGAGSIDLNEEELKSALPTTNLPVAQLPAFDALYAALRDFFHALRVQKEEARVAGEAQQSQARADLLKRQAEDAQKAADDAAALAAE